MRSRQLLFLCIATALAGQTLFAADPAAVESLLKERIIDPKLPLQEVENFCEARVLPMPEVKTPAEWEEHVRNLRRSVFERVVFRGAAAGWRDAKTNVEWTGEIEGGPGYRIRKLRYEALPGLWIPALLYEPLELKGKVPVVMNVNGHDGNGKAAAYKQIRCINQAKRGMLALNVEWLGMGQLRGEDYVHYRMNQLDLCGTSGLAPFYLSMQRGLDVLLAHENADPKHVAVAGLSGGGWQTIVISALDERVTLSDPVAGYSSYVTRVRNHSDLGDSEQTPVDLAATADYKHLTAMRAPRPTLLTFNAKDQCCFKADHALPPLMEAARPIFALYGKADHLRSHVNEDPGTHNFELDNRQQLYKMFGDFFFAEAAEFDWKEIASDGEVKTAEELQVPLPEQNCSFHSLAVGLAAELPRDGALPTTKDEAQTWQAKREAVLADLVRFDRADVQATVTGQKEAGGVTATLWRLRVGGNWTLPAVELVAGKPSGTTILIADEGRAAASKQAAALLDRGQRVLAVDPFYLGESKIASRDFLFGLLVSSVGERPLGVQAGQLAAVSRWAREQFSEGAPTIAAVGPRTSLMALVAAALAREDVGGLELSGSFGSLKQILEQNMSVQQAPDLFCFGLLERFDILQLAALTAPRKLEFVAADERVRKELAPLAAWYELWGAADAAPRLE
ncbi:MAG: acetylxylan esterase [Planctomycetes bacterium]|nr:acetylxylan esterase [Planctomycetota bacterium]